MLFKLFGGILLLKNVMSQGLMIPGSQVDGNNCVLDGGYSWCESSQKCQRFWEEPCLDYVDYCQSSNVQMCRLACEEPECPQGQCAMRVGNCCDYTCVTSEIDLNMDKCSECLQYPCPEPAVQSNCNVVQPVIDHCGCPSGCPTIDCSTSVIKNSPIPLNCLTWYNGCNTCSVLDGELTGCTLMMCFTHNDPYCQAYTTGELNIGDLCYRFCEDNSQTFVDRHGDCPRNTICGTESEIISSDNCGNLALKCVSIGH